MAPIVDRRTAADTETLVLEHRRLARYLAHRYIRGNEQREDLEQVAYLGLVKAARRFDHERGVAFTTFAMPTILGELRRYCRDTRWSVHVPRGVQERVQALRRLDDEYQREHDRRPTPSEAAAILGWPQEDVLDARLAAGGLSAESLNVRVNGADGIVGEAIDSIGEDDAGFEAAERRDELRGALAHLRPTEQRALRMRGEHGCSTREIALALGLSPSQAARLIARAVARLRGVLDISGEGMKAELVADGPVVRLCEVDPDLFAELDPRARLRARAEAIARRVRLEPGRWTGPENNGSVQLVLGGAIVRSVLLDGPPRAELIGPGDVLRGPADGVWQVVEPVQLAVLDARALDLLCRWPPVVRTLLSRCWRRSDPLAITHPRRVDDRLLRLFAAVGERWGRQTPRGIAIPFALTHDIIAMLVGAHPPTVTSALRRLARAGRLRRDSDGWLLTGTGDSAVSRAA